MRKKHFAGVGLGLRREMIGELIDNIPSSVDFWEVAPENWIPLGGKYQKQLSRFTGASQFVTHGLSLSIGGPEPLDINFVKDVKAFLDTHNIEHYSEHLSYCSGKGHLYDLMPIPFSEEAVKYVVRRVETVQDIIERPLILENVSYYAAPNAKMSERDFTLAVLEESNCKMLLDVNNIYVNSINHGYDAEEFLASMPTSRILYGHIAGHFDEADDLKVDTHGADVIQPVWDLLEKAYEIHGVFPTLLERDFNIPPINELLLEVEKIRKLQEKHSMMPSHQEFA
ncbi:HvfB family MNIO-type RiPP peptide maturase [Paraglaciecola polaris]|uniref:Uncharacterized protein n=1 Tax=Paraglaciecola polaris LMG 21857 TaxID=1129793 RepID=K6ZS66_9ALTE|nr:DUF692 domain-containing protein [Paraglaciecola polaris]GAC31673.1 hypothetical protein GPLA_0757 [Paraglaciecola polaris LMG 21857]|tara:strand:+ start:119 stop:967 length:849 start_codon:yes stop_codon:yes gene_type:complete